MPRILASFGNASQNNVQHLHVLFRSPGGVIHEGIRLYNFFRNFSIDLTLYNLGVVSSVAVIPCLGAKTRKVSRHATFMIRRTRTTDQLTNSDRVRAPAESVPAQCVFVRSRNVSRGKIMSPEPIEI
jgi:ATP-dependent protease ClpP protease subunit